VAFEAYSKCFQLLDDEASPLKLLHDELSRLVLFATEQRSTGPAQNLHNAFVIGPHPVQLVAQLKEIVRRRHIVDPVPTNTGPSIVGDCVKLDQFRREWENTKVDDGVRFHT